MDDIVLNVKFEGGNQEDEIFRIPSQIQWMDLECMVNKNVGKRKIFICFRFKTVFFNYVKTFLNVRICDLHYFS